MTCSPRGDARPLAHRPRMLCSKLPQHNVPARADGESPSGTHTRSCLVGCAQLLHVMLRGHAVIHTAPQHKMAA